MSSQGGGAPPSKGKGKQAQRGGWADPRSHSQLEAGLGWKLRFLHQLLYTRNPGGAVDKTELCFALTSVAWLGPL